MTRRFDFITELPGNHVTDEQVAMIAARYAWAAGRVRGDVLEVACGPGLGFGLLAAAARRLVGGDLDARCLAPAVAGRDAEIARFDALRMPFGDASFDAVLIFEAIYYLPDVRAFVTESRRLLRPGGRLLVTAPNPAWPAFAASPQSSGYPDPAGYVDLLTAHGFRVQVSGMFPQDHVTRRQRLLGALRRVTTRLGLVPKDRGRTEAVRAAIKRALYGRLRPLPARLSPADVPSLTPVPVAPDVPDRVHRVLYVEGVLP